MDTLRVSTDERTVRSIYSAGILSENIRPVHIPLRNPFVLRSNAVALQDGANTRTHFSKNNKMKETGETKTKANKDKLHFVTSAEDNFTVERQSNVSLYSVLVANIVINIMCFLDPISLLHFRAVCRVVNAVFCFPGICQRFASRFMRAAMGTRLEIDTVGDFMCKRANILRRKEEACAFWTMDYIAEKLDETKNKEVLHNMKMVGKSLRVQQQNANEFYRRALEEWLGHQADCRRVQYNIFRNWFNVSSLSCKLGFGVPPVFLPDGTLCVNDPYNTVLFFLRRDRKELNCTLKTGKISVPSRSVEALRDVWCLFGKITLPSEVTLMYYDPYMNGLHVGLENCETTVIRVRSAFVTGLERRLGELPKMAPPLRKERLIYTVEDNENEGVEFLTRYSTVGSNGFGAFIQLNRDAIGLPDYEWDEEEMQNLCFAHGGGKNNNRLILVKQERDVTASLLSFSKNRETLLTQKDIVELIYLQQQLSVERNNSENRQVIGSAGGGNGGGSLNDGNLSLTTTTTRINNPQNETNTHGNLRSAEPVTYSDDVTAVQINSLTEGRETTNSATVDFHRSSQLKERYVFGVFNEQTTLFCSLAYTREIALFALSLYKCSFLGTGFAGDARKVHILKAPEFQPCEGNQGEIVTKGDILIACEEASSIVICQHTIFRKIKSKAKCVYDISTSDGGSSSNNNNNGGSGNNGNNNGDYNNNLNRITHRTWYFLKGYYYESNSNDLKIIMEINSPFLSGFVNPRPWFPREKYKILKTQETNTTTSTTSVNINKNKIKEEEEEKKDDDDDDDEKEKKKKNFFFNGCWCPYRDGHPYFREPFMLYLKRNIPFISFPRKTTLAEKQELSLEERPFFNEVNIFESTRQSFLRVSSIVLSPIHALFFLGMDNGAILLVSPLCVKKVSHTSSSSSASASSPRESNKTKNNNNNNNNNGAQDERQQKQQQEQKKSSTTSDAVVPLFKRCREALSQVKEMPLKERRSTNKNKRTNNNNYYYDDDDDDSSSSSGRSGTEEEEEEQNGDGDLPESCISSSPPMNHLYRNVQINLDNNVQHQYGRRLHIYSFTAEEIFGNGFLEDGYILKLQSMANSILTPIPSEGLENIELPLHAVWLFLPHENNDSAKFSAIWSMHVDEWKLTTLSAVFEIAIYSLEPQAINGNCGVVFSQLLTISPYKRYPYTFSSQSRVKFCCFPCSKIQHMIQVETKRHPSGSEIMWQNGTLVVYSSTGGNRCTIFDFSESFTDPDLINNKKNKNNKNNKDNDTQVAYSTTLKEYHRFTPGVTLLISEDSSKRDGPLENKSTTITFSRHYPLLLRQHFLMLLSIVMRPIILFCSFIAVLLVMLRIDEYINISFWIPLAFYAPFAFATMFHYFILYDKYYEEGCGIQYYTSFISKIFSHIIFPILFTARQELYDKFHPPWLLLTISLDISLLIASIPSFFLLLKSRCICIRLLSPIANCFSYLCCIASIVLFSIYFDAPSAKDPRMPKFPLVIAFLPLFLSFILITVKIFAHFITINCKLCLLSYLCVFFVFAAPIFMFIGQFNYYWAAIDGSETVRRPSLIQTCFFFPLLLLGMVFYLAVFAFVLLRN